MDGLPARTGVRLPSEADARDGHPTQNCKNMCFCWEVFPGRGWGEGPLSGIALLLVTMKMTLRFHGDA